MNLDHFIPLARPDAGPEEIAAVEEVIRSGWWTTGPAVARFEEALTDYLEGDAPLHVVGLNSCTAAIFLALEGVGIGPGDEVIVPTWTFAATAQVVEWLGARPVLCDVEAGTLNMDVSAAARCITEHTRAIVPVHFAGYPCDQEGIEELAARHGLKVIEDAAHAIGSAYDGRLIGNFGDITCFSFYATKNVAMGEGGAVVSNDAQLIDRIRQKAYFGIKKAEGRYAEGGNWAYDIETLGYKFNLDSIHAAIGQIQLAKVERMNERRRAIAARYRSDLHPSLKFFQDNSKNRHIYHLFTALLPQHIDRGHFIGRLRDARVGASVHYIPLHRHSHFQSRFDPRDFPVAEEIFPRIVSLPMCSAMTDQEVTSVISTVNRTIEDLT
ncbi:aminotransferase class I/II-fold pyridoxal phosphate-dependent enzyme [candidate division KSB3 bacterium]|nr:aminotransferase class I/II-fold pyridoxal phosphate-dependent enzyme [candidate division KSB3 bacterium]